MAGTTYLAHELKTRLKGHRPAKVIVSWKEADLSDNPLYHVALHVGWQAKGALGRYVRRWEVEESYRDAKQHLGLGRCQMQSIEGTRRHWYLRSADVHPVQAAGVPRGLEGGLRQGRVYDARRLSLGTEERGPIRPTWSTSFGAS